jgi:hypothetical protein
LPTPCYLDPIHLPQEVIHIGPPICSSQWTLKCTIGNLGEKIKQHSNPFANISQCGIWRAQANALNAIIPDLCVNGSSEEALPHGAKDLGDGFILLHAHKGEPWPLQECEAKALCEFLPTAPRGVKISVRRWAKLQLLTRQNCNSAWKELQKPLER